MQQEYILTNDRPTVSVTSLWFRPNKIIVLNNTSNPVYVRRGGADIPTVFSKDYVVPAQSGGLPTNVSLPTVADEFAFALVTNPPLSDATQVVTVILQGDGTLPTGFFESRLTPDRPAQSIETPFNPNHVFIYNPTDAYAYFRVGGLDVPDKISADITVLPQTFYIFTPFNSSYYGAFLDSPSAWECVFFLIEGDADFGRRVFEFPNIDPGIAFALNPLPSPAVSAAFTFVVL